MCNYYVILVCALSALKHIFMISKTFKRFSKYQGVNTKTQCFILPKYSNIVFSNLVFDRLPLIQLFAWINTLSFFSWWWTALYTSNKISYLVYLVLMKPSHIEKLPYKNEPGLSDEVINWKYDDLAMQIGTI